MNTGAQEVAKRVMEQAVTRQTALAGERGRDDQQAKMTTTAFGAGVAGVPRGVVDHLQAKRLKNAESLLNDCLNLCSSADSARVTHAGSTFLNGLTVTAA